VAKRPVDPFIAANTVLANVALIVVCYFWGYLSLIILAFVVIPILVIAIIVSLVVSVRHWGNWAALRGPAYGLLGIVISAPLGYWNSMAMSEIAIE
jgi:hypothetical protein